MSLILVSGIALDFVLVLGSKISFFFRGGEVGCVQAQIEVFLVL